jgi:hypothetical protein
MGQKSKSNLQKIDEKTFEKVLLQNHDLLYNK